MNLQRLRQETEDYGKTLSANDPTTQPCLSYSGPLQLPIPSPPPAKCVITVENVDCLDAVKRYPNGVVLNLASDICPGGGWGHALAQEESIFYRTSAYRSLRRNNYPLSQGTVLYTPTLEVYRSSDYKLLPPPQRWRTSMISCAGLRRPQLFNNQLTQPDYDQLVERIHRIVQVAILHKHTYLVLGALGCGAFRCPVYDVVHAYKHVLSHYSSFFHHIVFAVLEDHRGTFRQFSQLWG